LIALFGAPLVNYYYYFAPSLTLLASPMIAQAIRQISSSTNRPLSRIIHARLPILFLTVLIANAGMTAAMLYATPTSWRNESLSSIYDVAAYIQAKTEISQFMASGGVKYVVADLSPPTLYIIGLHPLWKATFLTNFVLETVIDGAAIYRYSPTWDLSQHLDAVVAFNNSTVYSYTYQAFVDGFGHLLISSWYASLQTVGGTIVSDQVLFHPPFVSGNSYIQISLPRNKYTNLTTSFALADGAVGRSNGVSYSVEAREGNQQLFLFNRLVTMNNWQQFSTLLPTGPDLTILLTSNSGVSSSYDWLQITLILQR
jgi:hypothetical protein